MAARQYYFGLSDAESTTTSATYGDKTSITFTPDASTTYLLLYACKLNSAGITLDARVRLRDDTAGTDLRNINLEAKDGSKTAGEYKSAFGMSLFTSGGSPSSQTFSVEFSIETAGTTASIMNCCLIAIRLEADDEIAENNTTNTTTSTSPQTQTTLTFTPPTAGDYLIIATGELNDNGSDGAGFSLYDGTTAYGDANSVSPDITNYLPVGTAVKLNLSASSKTFTTRYDTHTGAANASMRNSAIVALRLEDFDASYYTESRARSTAATATYQTKISHSPNPVTSLEHLILWAAFGDSSSTTVSAFYRGAEAGTALQETHFEAQSGGTGAGLGVYNLNFTVKDPSNVIYSTDFRSETSAATTGIQDAVNLLLQLEGSGAADLPPVSRISLPLYKRPTEEFTFRFAGVGDGAQEEGNQETINRRQFLLPPTGVDRVDYFTWFQPPLADDNYASFSRVWELPNPVGLDRTPIQGVQFSGELADFFEQAQETLNRRTYEVPNGLDRFAVLDFSAAPLADDNYESAARVHYDLAPTSRIDPFDYTGIAAAPLSADNYESFARTSFEVPPGRNPSQFPWDGLSALANPSEVQDFIIPFEGQVPAGYNPLRTPWEGAQASPLPADAAVDTPLLGLIYPDFLFKQHRHDPVFIFDGFFQAPLSDDFVPPAVQPGVFRPTIRPRRR